jgi:hypothetical protein
MDRMDSRIEKFRGHAEACEALVFITKHHDARQQLLDIAKQWRDLMIRAEMIQQLARLEWGDPADPLLPMSLRLQIEVGRPGC